MTEWTGREREAWLTLALTPGIGAARHRALIDRFDSPNGALSAPFELLCAVAGMSAAAATAVTTASRQDGVRAMRAAESLGAVLLIPGDPGFPPGVAEIPDPPVHLFALGNLDLLSTPAVAIVGSRDHTDYGAEVTRALARAAAGLGIPVVSGMARGLDAVAHAGALDAAGGSIGVLGNGLGVIYPAANRVLYHRMAEGGLLITEFPPGERPGAGSFPRRNRLISGLSRAVVVVEAALTSGALQTAACALEQGREVLAVPGPITSPVSSGTNRLIRDGATPLLDLDDLLAVFPERAPPARGQPPDEAGALRPVEGRLVNALWAGPRRAEELVEATGAPVGEALDALSALELSGRVQQGAAGLYRLVSPLLFG